MVSSHAVHGQPPPRPHSPAGGEGENTSCLSFSRAMKQLGGSHDTAYRPTLDITVSHFGHMLIPYAYLLLHFCSISSIDLGLDHHALYGESVTPSLIYSFSVMLPC